MGIFDHEVDLFAVYEAEIKMRDRIMGGVPKAGKAKIEGWLKKGAGITEKDELMRVAARTIAENGSILEEGQTVAQLEEKPSHEIFELLEAAAREHAAMDQTNGFKKDENGIYLESRCIKAMIREVTNILFAGAKWGTTRKGPKNFVAERVFINPDKIRLRRPDTTLVVQWVEEEIDGEMEWVEKYIHIPPAPEGVKGPDDTDLFVGHTSGAQGPQSNLTLFEFVEGATLTFEVMVAEDALAHEQWARMWVLGQEVGLGALRSQGHGRFDIERWEKVRQSDVIKPAVKKKEVAKIEA